MTAGLCGAAVLLAAAGCAEPGPTSRAGPRASGLATVRQAVDGLLQAGTSRTRTSLRALSGGTRVTITGRGRFDYVQRRGKLTVTPPGPLRDGASDEPITELLTPGAVHVRNRGADIPRDKWVRLDPARLVDGNLLANGATDPLRAAELLRGAVDAVHEGRGRLGDTRVHHYSGTGDLHLAARAARRHRHGSVDQLDAAAAGFDRADFAFDAWFDERGRLRKVRLGFESGTVSSTTTMYDFGVPVTVSMPDPDDIHAGRIGVP